MNTTLSVDELQRLYHNEKLSAAEIGLRFGLTVAQIHYRIKRDGIVVRTKSEAARIAHKNENRKKTVPKTPVKTHILCRKCGADWDNNKTVTMVRCPFCENLIDARDRATYTTKLAACPKRQQKRDTWAKSDAHKKAAMAGRILVRKRLFFKICGSINPKCVRCGCDDKRLLEINHKNGGGSEEYGRNSKGKSLKRSSVTFYYSILDGRRSTDDLEILCKPCNAIHYLELKYGTLPMQVIWKGG